MRITVDIDAKDLAAVQTATGIRKKSPALKRVVQDYLRALRKRAIIAQVREGKTDYATTNEELERRARYDTG